MHKPEPPKTEIQMKMEEAGVKNEQAMNAIREELGKTKFDYSLSLAHMDVSGATSSSPPHLDSPQPQHPELTPGPESGSGSHLRRDIYIYV